MTQQKSTFGTSFGQIFLAGVRGYFRQPIPLSAAALVTLSVYLVFRLQAQAAFEAGDIVQSIVLDLVGLVLASIVAYPWYSYALDADRGDPIDVRSPLRNKRLFYTQAVASFWFWAAVLLGLRYLFGIPSLLAVVFYAFYGFVTADGKVDGGLMALGTSARITEGKRIGILALAGVFFFFNIFGAVALGFAVNAGTIILAVAGLTITTNITMVSGAHLFRLISTGGVK